MKPVFIIVIALVCQAVSAMELKKGADSVIDPEALYFTSGTWGNCVNGQTFQQDALASFNGYQYTAYYDSARRRCVARRCAGESAWEFQGRPIGKDENHPTTRSKMLAELEHHWHKAKLATPQI